MFHMKLIAGLTLVAACAGPKERVPEPSQPALLAAQLQETVTEPEKPEKPEAIMAESPPEPKRPAQEPSQPAYQKTASGIAGLPRSDGQTFQSLDAYLAHLEKGGHIDLPFWEQLKNGKYRWNTGRGMRFQEPKYATREELLAKYGFEN